MSARVPGPLIGSEGTSAPTRGGALIAFEGMDQSGKQTQTERLLAALKESGRATAFLSFPDYATALGGEIRRALRGERDYGADVMQLLYITNRYEHRRVIVDWLAGGTTVVCDRYQASSIAYGSAQGLDAKWLTLLQAHLPPASLTVLLDIPPEVSMRRKDTDRDRYERDRQLLERVRESYLLQAAAEDWVRIDGTEDKETVSQRVQEAVRSRLGLL